MSAVISMAQALPNLCVSRKVFLKHLVNWNTVCRETEDLPWRNICFTHNPVELLNEHLSLLLDVMYQPRSSVCVTRISLFFIINAMACSWPQAGGSSSVVRDRFRVNWEGFVRWQVRANETY